MIWLVRDASIAISTGGLVEATEAVLWCSATQYLMQLARSATCASEKEDASACPLVWPRRTGMRSRTDSCTMGRDYVDQPQQSKAVA